MGQGYPDTPGIHSSEQVAAWQQVVKAVHAAGGRIFLQLWHVGRISHSLYHDGALPVSASAVPYEGMIRTPDFSTKLPAEAPRALSTAEVAEVVAEYRTAAANAKVAGFDGVEIHAANGYLIEQFLRTGTNHRSDVYGGSLTNRLRFLKEVTEAVLQEWSSHCVGVRLSPGAQQASRQDADPVTTYRAAAQLLSTYDLAYLHTVEAEVAGYQASQLMRDAYRGVHMLAGELTRESGKRLIENGAADLVAYGRLFISNPDLPERFATNAPLNDWDTETFYGGGAQGYTDYPSLANTEKVS